MVAFNSSKFVLADTSVWVDHFRRGNPALAKALAAQRIGTHDFVIGELTLGSLPQPVPDVGDLRLLPLMPIVETDVCIAFVREHRLIGKGLGWMDAHLLASASLAKVGLWTLDRSLRQAAERLELFEVP
ncbi:MAG: PIN domain-containing protein [Phycisphaeraceae bacterium]|nr:PIN domain-containing protein [Phycisphaeraceae bacterium]